MEGCSSLSPRPASSASSSPLSRLSTTPSLPGSPIAPPDVAGRYPSPMSSSTVSGTQSPIKLGDAIPDDSPRPRKKPRLAPSRPRSTAYLDLCKPDEELSHEDNFHLERLLSALRKKKKVVVIAGAGISVSAGIPDFRSATGLFATAKSQHKLKASGKHLFDASVYKHDSSTQSFHTMVREMACLSKSASPTPFHHLLASLAKEGRLMRLYSQNIDCIDTSMAPLATAVPLEPKGPWPSTIQLHGGLQKMVCTKCGDLKDFDGDLFSGPEAPLCETCKESDQVRTTFAGKRSHGIGRLRPRFVLYNEFNPDEEAIGNVARADLKARPDAVVVVGTTLKVPGTRRLVKEMCQVARGRKDGFTAWINIDSEPKGVDFKDCWDLVVRSKCDNVARLTALPPYDCEIGNDYHVSSEQYAEKLQSLRKSSIEIGIPSSPTKSDTDSFPNARLRALEATQTIPTPRPSPPAPSQKPAPKRNQTTIAFASKTGAPAPQQTGNVSKRARKTNRAAKAKAPRPNMTVDKAFKTDKNISSSGSGLKGRTPSLGSLVKLGSDAANALPPLRPQRQNSSDSLSLICVSSDGKAGGATARSPPPTSPLDKPLCQDVKSAETLPSVEGAAVEPPVAKLMEA